MKVFAFYLPQFHEIPENNKWWGQGFTEWVNVKKAKPLFPGHKQPMHPLDDNYYNLLNKNTVEWQTSLLKQYRIDGLIYYHYYFDGKLLLEKPAENLLAWKDIDHRFFFCWANHSWKRTWNGTNEILVDMKYGDIKSWEKHFDYLLQFFRDDRYEKIDNKPIFMLFKSDFEEKNDMLQYFNKRCIDCGFNGIAVIETFHNNTSIVDFSDTLSPCTRYTFYREPAVQWFGFFKKNKSIFQKLKRRTHKILREIGIEKKPQIFDGNDLMTDKINNEPLNKRIAHGVWFEWDNTPRHQQRGYIITPYRKELFFKYMDKVRNEDFVFVNAWNEWCEGMVLEPTKEKGYKYLEWIKEWKDRENT